MHIIQGGVGYSTTFQTTTIVGGMITTTTTNPVIKVSTTTTTIHKTKNVITTTSTPGKENYTIGNQAIFIVSVIIIFVSLALLMLLGGKK